MSVDNINHQNSRLHGVRPLAAFRGSPDGADISAVAIFSSIGLLVSLLTLPMLGAAYPDEVAFNILLSLLG
jgi:hypothetical protein